MAQGLGSSLIYYRDVFVYAGDELLYVQHPSGLIRKTDRGYIYNYFLQDHLGSTRVLLEGSGAGLTAEQATDYYPYGLAFHLNNLEQNKYLYSGKEYQDASIGGEGLGLYDFGSRFYDPYLARWFCQDPALQMISPYGYCGNNPVMFVDPDGEFVLTAFLIGATVGILIDYGIQVASNYAMGYRGADAWAKKVDFFDMAVSGVVSGFTAGYGSALKAGQTVGRFGQFFVKSPKLVTLGETVLTSAIDVTGDGWQDVSFDDFGTRAISAGVQYGVSSLLKNRKTPIENNSNQEGGLNLFKFGKEQTMKLTDWKTGDYMLNIPDKGNVRLNWKTNYGMLRSEMKLGKPIFDSFRLSTGELIPTNGFLNAERYILQTRGWIYSPKIGAWLPPLK